MFKKIISLLIIFLLVFTVSSTLTSQVYAGYCDIPDDQGQYPSICP